MSDPSAYRFTPGPYSMQKQGKFIYIWSEASRGAALCQLKIAGQPDNLQFDTTERIAFYNAKLFVAAPQMVEFLRNYVAKHDASDNLMDDARSILRDLQED